MNSLGIYLPRYAFRQPLLAALLVCGLPGALPAQAQGAAADTRYVQASQLNLRAEAAPAAATLAPLHLNEAVSLRKKISERWCLVETTDVSRKSGYVDCSFLADKALTLEKIELDFAAQALALHRLNRQFDGTRSSLDSLPRDLHKEALRAVEQMASLIERHFALAPSFYAYQNYADLLSFLQHFDSADNPAAEKSPLSGFGKSRLPQLRAMEAGFTRDFAAQPAALVPSGIDTALKAIMAERGALLANPALARSAKRAQKQARVQQRAARNAFDLPATPSFFQQDKWAVGWAGGPLIKRRRAADAQGVGYDVSFDGVNVLALAEVYEMAKVQRLPVKVQFKTLAGGELSQMGKAPDGTYRGAIVQLGMPVWAITASGLVKGTLRQVSFGGDVCSDGGGGVATGAELVFPQPVRETIQAVFATNAVIDPAKARVQLRKRAFLEGGGSTLTGRVDVSVDLDGDGVADLRTVVSTDQDVSFHSGGGFVQAGWLQGRRASGFSPYVRRVAGWYANDVFTLEANMGDAWRVLSIYSVSTCT